MKRLAPIIFAAAATLTLAACESGPYHAGPVAAGYVDGYYDDAYGPFYDGYWGDGGFFYYRAGPDADFRRDDAHHFRREAGQGFHNFHARAGAPAGHPGGRAG
jgi:hypothetical protein